MSAYEEVVLRHAEYYMLVLEECDRLYKSGGDNLLIALNRFDEERENLFLGRERTEGHAAHNERALNLCNRFPDVGALLLPMRLTPEERLRWRLPALDAARKLHDLSAEAAHLVCLGNIFDNMNDYDAAVEAYEQALALKRQLGDENGEAIALQNLALTHVRNGQPERALAILGARAPHPDTITITDTLEPEPDSGKVVGLANLVLGRTDLALQHLERSLVIARASGDLRLQAGILGGLSRAYAARDNVVLAEECLDTALALTRTLGDRAMEGGLLVDRGLLAIAAGNADRGEQLIQDGFRMLAGATGALSPTYRLRVTAAAAHLAGDLQRAEPLYEKLLGIARSSHDRLSEIELLDSYSTVLTALGYVRRAIDCHDRAERLRNQRTGESEEMQ